MPKMGFIIPIMGNKAIGSKFSVTPRVREAAARYAVQEAPTSLADALFTTTQQRVLGLLYGQPQRSFTISEVISAAGTGSGAAQRELAGLSESGLLTVRSIGNQKHYQANPSAPIYDELVGIIQKTVGLAEPLRKALMPLMTKITAAFVYGSVAKRADTAASDIDLMIVADKLGYADVMHALHPVIQQLGREINPTIYTRAELTKRIAGDNAFVTRVLQGPKLWLMGGEDDLRA